MKGQEAQQEQHEDTEHPDYDNKPDKHWWWLHYRRVNRDISPIIEFRRLAWSNYYDRFHATLVDHGVDQSNYEFTLLIWCGTFWILMRSISKLSSSPVAQKVKELRERIDLKG